MPDFSAEARAWARGAKDVAGVDEAGRGPLAGPVVAAAVILDPKRIPPGLDDSKRLSAKTRERLCAELFASAVVAVAAAPPTLIADRNILGATLWAMRQAVLGLARRPDHVLVDGNRTPSGLPCQAEPLVGGDRLSLSVAAASIVAKVVRDEMCAVMHAAEPRFDFAAHKGYGTPVHLTALMENGPGRFHRLGFAPCAAAHRAR